MDDRTLNPDDARERIAAWKGRIDKLAADTKTMSDRFQQLEVSTTDPAGLARVTVDSSGGLVDLRLTREIERVSPDEVASTIMRTIRAAKAELADRTEEIIEETVGTESAAGRAIADRVGQQLRSRDSDDEPEDQPEPEHEPADAPLRPPAPPAEVRPARVRDDEYDDGDETTIWR